ARWKGQAIAPQEILQRLDALGVAPPLAIDAGADPDHVRTARAFAAARAVAVPDRPQFGATCGELLVGLLRLRLGHGRQDGRYQQQISEPLHRPPQKCDASATLYGPVGTM